MILVKARRRVASNSKWQVYLDHLIDPRGNEVSDYLVIEPVLRNVDGTTGICILPLVDGSFGLLSVHRHTLGRSTWEAPKGFIDRGETPSEAALRELFEETGLSTNDQGLISLGHYMPEPSTMLARGALFAAECRVTGEPLGDELGIDALTLFPAEKMAQMVGDGTIEDAATLIAYYRYLQNTL